MNVKSKVQFFFLILIALFSCNHQKEKLGYQTTLDINKEYYVIYLAGQSNMAGLGNVSQLTDKTLPNNVSFFNYSTDTKLNSLPYNFGPEVGLAKKLNEKFPNLNFIFIKYAISGSSISEWLPNVESQIERNIDFGEIYLNFLKMSKSITDNYKTQNLAFIWMQGEADACYKNTSKSYETYLKSLIDRVRKDFNNDNLPFIFGKVNTEHKIFKFVPEIQQAQLHINSLITNTYLIDTDNLEKLNDNIHYSTQGQLDLGKAFGTTVNELIIQKTTDFIETNKD
ncbi:sialate O-acetylesterase [Winogradskyella endarachnes]|uniref:Sialate O-acetylesterase domain-containing protein n=1 Tax=Winogradskyella endarachnes TaxID=2681965 RepID=A0A6L6U592_9FLAO|nr:sialate O-acetylesterase [Winogradskyella endarachnes]MUU77208.1 hypothetical protein [Winogradskyella endarachnes]